MNSNELSRGAELTIRQNTHTSCVVTVQEHTVAQTDSNPIHIQEIVRR